jgi:hypothetical protein
MWIVPPPEALRRLREMGRVPLEGTLGIANAALGVMPLRVMCDAGDLGAVRRFESARRARLVSLRQISRRIGLGAARV